jgi:CheY-like chemotaxis protein
VISQRAIKVLIVDDDSLDIYLLHKTLRRLGIENVESLRTGEDASKYIVGLAPFEDRLLPDVIFLDLKMNGIDGFEFISFVKRNPLFRNIPLIVLSGSTDPRDREKALHLGASAFFQKTSELDEMKAMLEESLTLCAA